MYIHGKLYFYEKHTMYFLCTFKYEEILFINGGYAQHICYKYYI